MVVCDELAKSCGTQPADDGVSCNPTDVCQVNGTCTNGICTGDQKDCSFSPLAECNAMHCNPSTGACEGTPDATKDGDACSLTGNGCNSGRTCSAGQCTGGSPKDCSALTYGCTKGVCNPQNGSCEGQAIPVGGACIDGIDLCHVGTCDAAGVCNATPTAGCTVYNASAFESCPEGWTLHGDWQCGTPTSGPSSAHSGTGVLATKLAGDYSSSQTYAACTADSPDIDLTTAVAPKLQFWAWIQHLKGRFTTASTSRSAPTAAPRSPR